MADATFTNKIRMEIEGSELVRQKIMDVIQVQREGLMLGKEELKSSRESIGQLNLQYRAINALSRSWQSAHPELALLTRGFSNLATVARSVLSFITSLSVAQMNQNARARERRDILQEIGTKEIEVQQLIAKGADETDPKVVKLRQEIQGLKTDLDNIHDNEIQDKFTNIGLAISGAFLALGSISNIMTAWTSLKIAGIELLGAMGPAGWLVLGLIAGAAAIFAGYQANFLGLKTDVIDPFLKETTDAFNAWSVDTQKTFGDWENVSAEDIESWIQRTAVGISVWASITGKILDRWVDKVLALVARLAEQFGKQIDKMLDDAGKYIDVKVEEFVKSFDKMVDDIVKAVTDLWKKLVGGSIWPDMLNQMQDMTKDKLGGIQNQFISFKDIITGAMTGTGDSFMSAVGEGGASLAGAANSLKSSIDQLVSVQQASNALTNIEGVISSLQSQRNSLSGQFAAVGGRMGASIMEENIRSQVTEFDKQIQEAQKQRDALISFATGASGITLSQFNALPAGLKDELIGQGIMSQSGQDATGQSLIPNKILQIITDNVTGGQHTQFSAVRPGRTDAEQRFLEATGFRGGRRPSSGIDIPSGPISTNPKVIQIINNIGGSVVTEKNLARTIAESIARDTQGLIR